MNREALIAAMQTTAKPKAIPVTIEDWGTLFVRPPTVADVEAQNLKREASGAPEKHRFAVAAARMICHEDGTRVFDPDSEEHIELLAQQPWPMLQKVLDAGAQDGRGQG